nr:zinc finger, CCHC-type [Tanacetum cinerariifolium]
MIEDVDFNQIFIEQREFLECNVSNEEIKRALWDCGGDRAPGPDGFTFKIFKTFWEVIQNDVRFVREFFQSACFPKGCNFSFIALIPKVGDAKLVLDFRLISLIGCQYKIIGKLLAKRLSTVIGSCVIFEQPVLIKGRNILDGPLVLNECMAWYRKRNKALTIFKVDFEKTLDSLRWDYLDVIIENLGVNVHDEEVSNMALVLGCGVAKLHMMYLGVPIGCNIGRCDNWKRIVENFESKMTRWKAKLLSVRGCLSLIKSVLGGDFDDKKITWVKWKSCLASKAMGGLGIGSIFALNAALLFKWVWSPWSSILRSVSQLQAKGIDLFALCGRFIGDGSSISFWDDSWCGGRPLKDMFPRVYALDGNKLCTVAQRINVEDWSSVLKRPPRGGAKSNQYDELILAIRDVVLSDSVDGWIWELRLDKLPTLVNLDKKGIDVDSLLCPVCNAHVETIDHLFFSCEMEHDLWGLLARWCALDIPEVSNVVEWFSWLDTAHVSKSARITLEGIASTMMWDGEVAGNIHQRVDGLSFVNHRVSKLKDTIRWYSIIGSILSGISLQRMSVVYVLTTPMPEDGGENPTVERVRKRAKWDNDDYVCRCLILNGMTDSLFDIYQNVDTSKELWDTLEAKYMAEDASSKKFFVSNFINYKMNDSRPVLQQYNELLRILGRFTQHKMNMDESIKVSCIIDKLPPSWKDFKHTLKHLKEKLTLVELGSYLCIEESLRAQDNDTPKGNNVAGPSVKPKVTCWKCEKPGHLKKDCEDGNVGNRANGSSTKGSEDGSFNPLKGQSMFNKSFQIYYVTYVSETFFVQDDDVAWWVDSGATVHVCKDRCWFKTYESLNDGSILHMGNESTAFVHRRGCVDLRFSSKKVVFLLNVLHVPNIRKNLVLNIILNNCGYEQVIESNKFVLSKHSVFIGFGYLSNQLFRLNIVSDNIGSAFMSTSKLNDLILWHARLGHVHFKRMQDMSKDSDLCDLHATPSLGNKKNFVTFIDDASRFCYVYLLHSNDEALDKFKVFKTKVELQQESLIKRFRTDRVGVINSIIELRDAIFDEHRFSSVPRPSQRSLDVAFWKEAINDKMDSIMGNNTWVLIDLPPCCRPLGCKWILKRKLKVDGTVETFKARLVIQGFNQKSGIYYFDTYAPVARIITIRLLIFMASIHNLIIHQMDMKTTFLNGDLEEEVYMNQPLGFIMPGNKNKVCKLIKSLYGLKHASKQWHQKFNEVVLSNGYLLNQAKKYVYSKFDASSKGVIICLYVDDMLIFGTDQVQVDLTKEFLSSRFSIKDIGEADVILGIRIKHESNGIAISQSHYIQKVLKKFNYYDCTPVSTPLDTCEKLMPNRGLAVSQLEYSRVIGCLMYAMICTRPDIAFAVGKLSRYTSNPRTQHWQAIHRVLKYLKKTMDYRFVYYGYPSVLKGYTDASWISNNEDNSSTSGWVFLLGGGEISWASKKQTCITGFTMESEFVALAVVGKEAEWLKNLLFEIPLWDKPLAPISIRCDSAATLAKAYSQMYNGKSRHLGVRHSMIRELIMNEVVSIEFVRSQQNLVDHLMKDHPKDVLGTCCKEDEVANFSMIEPSAGMLHNGLADDSGL